MKTIYIIAMFLFSVAAFAQEQKTEQSQGDLLAPKAFEEKIKETPGAMVLDVRTPEEVKQGKIKDAKNIDFNNSNFEKEVAKLDKDKTYFVYCAKGGRSSKAYAILKSSGFKNVYDLEGGFTNWKEMGLPIVKK
jgi:rhodanese-related sulfurtransferase